MNKVNLKAVSHFHMGVCVGAAEAAGALKCHSSSYHMPGDWRMIEKRLSAGPAHVTALDSLDRTAPSLGGIALLWLRG